MAEPYDRKRCIRAYMSSAYGFYETHHVERAVTLIFKAMGFSPHGKIANWVARVTCWFMEFSRQQSRRAGARRNSGDMRPEGLDQRLIQWTFEIDDELRQFVEFDPLPAPELR
jgi:hypothetical protein